MARRIRLWITAVLSIAATALMVGLTVAAQAGVNHPHPSAPGKNRPQRRDLVQLADRRAGQAFLDRLRPLTPLLPAPNRINDPAPMPSG